MKHMVLAVSLAGFGLVAVLPLAARAANADNPYGNIDHSNDAGNNTGDSQVDGLNKSQLNRNYQGPLEVRPPNGPVMLVPAQPQMAQPGMPPPPPPVPTVR